MSLITKEAKSIIIIELIEIIIYFKAFIYIKYIFGKIPKNQIFYALEI